MANGSTNYVFDVAVSQTFIVNWVEAAPTEYIVSYNAGEGQGGGDIDYVAVGSKITLAAPADVNCYPVEGKEFDAWSINGIRYDVGDEYTVVSDTYIIALWKDAPVQKYTVTYKANGGTGSDVVVENIEAGSQYTLIIFAQSGFTAPSNKEFDCWKVNGVSKQPGETITVNENTTVLANWKDQGAEPEPTYTVSFNANGGGSSMADVNDVSGDYVLPACGFTAPNANKEFAGWKINNEGELLQPGAHINVSSNVVLYAQWKDSQVDPEKTLVSISLSGTHQTEFTVGDTFSAEGLVVTAHYSDDSSEVIDLNNVEISGYNMNQEGKQTITVSYQGKTATYEITVKAKDTPVTPDDPVTPNKSSGLPAGAVVGIVIGSALVVGVGGFALVWFVIKKKTWADFVALFKKK